MSPTATASQAAQLLSRGQRTCLTAAALCTGVALLLVPVATLQVLVSAISLLYAAVVAHRLVLVVRGSRQRDMVRISDEEARAEPSWRLPTYTVLVPVYHEPEVVGQLLAALDALEYPRERLDVHVLLERGDEATAEAVSKAQPRRYVTVRTVPADGPRTKPHACNHGLEHARGSLLTIYDAEDLPEPLQLRRAAVAMRRSPEIACLQARLQYHNATQNLITRWFTNEYDVWFSYFLPGLVSTGAPVPLGGTSNHLRTRVLREVGGWDDHNVTEDADLGLRLHRAGWRTEVLDSVTQEEANSDFVNWVKQRSRWYKGYLSTWLVHARDPRGLVRDSGWRGLLGLHLFVGGTPLLAILNPVLWCLTLGWIALGAASVSWLFAGPAYYVSLVTWLVGWLVPVYSALYATREHDRPELCPALLLLPLYWVMMSLAATKALLQLVSRPAYWEKTTHGLDRVHAGAPG